MMPFHSRMDYCAYGVDPEETYLLELWEHLDALCTPEPELPPACPEAAPRPAPSRIVIYKPGESPSNPPSCPDAFALSDVH